MPRSETAIGVFGVLATLFGVGLLLAPDIVYLRTVERLTLAVTESSPTELMLVLGVVTSLLVVVAAWPRTASPPADDTGRFDEAVRQTAGPADRTVAGTDLLGAEVETAIREGGESWQQVRSTLSEVAADTYARAAGVSPAAAGRAVERGQWTEDDLAAGVLSGERALPGRARLRLWLAPERERRRRIERTAMAIERLQER